MFNLDTKYKLLLDNWGTELETGTVLVVGFDSFNIANFIRNNITGFDTNITSTNFPNLKILQGDITKFPFSDNYYDYVICSDLLQRLSFGERSLVVTECIRVAKKKCMIIGPHGELALTGDIGLKLSFERLQLRFPAWLDENINNGFPRASKTLSDIFSAGYLIKIYINKYFIQHYSGILMDIVYINSSDLRSIQSCKNVNSSIPSNDGDLPYSLLFCIDKLESILLRKDIFIKKNHLNEEGLEYSLGITIFSIFHDLAYGAFKGAYGKIDIFKLIKPIFIGRGLDATLYQVQDPDGFFENQNDRCSELTAIHYIWRNNLFSDIVGFCHYRRYLYLSENELDGVVRSQYQIHIKPQDFKKYINRIEDNKRIKYLLKNYDILTSIPRLLDNTIENHYNLNHFSSDYYKCIEIALMHHPYLSEAIFESMNSNELYTSNIFITDSKTFNNICNVWFDILEKCSLEIDISGRNDYQKRDIAFLSERVFDIIIRHLKKLDYKVHELPILFIDF